MNHFSLILSKLVAMLVVLYIILGLFYGVSFLNVFWITLTLGIVSYLVGDLLILPRTNNFVASLVDFALVFGLIYFWIDAYAFAGNLFTASLISAIAVTAFEIFFHRSIGSQLKREQGMYQRKRQLQTEASREIDPLVEQRDRRNKRR